MRWREVSLEREDTGRGEDGVKASGEMYTGEDRGEDRDGGCLV